MFLRASPPVLRSMCGVRGYDGPSFIRRPTPIDAPGRRISRRAIYTWPNSSYRLASVTDIPLYGRCPVSFSHISGPTPMSANCSLLTASQSHPLTAGAKTISLLGPLAPCLTYWQWRHSSKHGDLERASTFVCLIIWWCSDMKLYSCKRWTHRFVCPSRIPKAQHTRQGGLVGAYVELLYKQILEEMLQGLHNCQYFSTGHTVVPLALAQSFAEVGHNPFAYVLTWDSCPPIPM